ncbi:MaoC family dehydratase N-terminal domain-containing protein [Mycobacterium sp.]|uniref:FAS1-like dehydratase domain-containing protein n=1 Tax=Mycobacterium sp. TaxID=1785 RepID=UPI0031E263CF
MSLPAGTEGLIGTHYRYPDYFDVGREKIREFATSVSNDHPAHHSEEAAAEHGYDATVAPLTFLAVAGRRVQESVFTKFDIPINMARTLHRDQKFLFHRSIKTGDRLYFDTYLDSVIESHGTVIAEIRSEVTDADGKPIITSIVTMLGESSNPDANAEATIAAIASIRAGA